jgi:DNA anti-recombination protein RmuC
MAAVLDMTETLDTRVARLESDVAHIHTVVSDIKIDLRQLRTEFSVLRNTTETGFKAASAELHQELKAVRAEIAGSNARSAEEFKAVRAEIANSNARSAEEFKAVRAEIANSNARTAEEFKAVRAEMQVGFAAGRTDLADLRREIHRRDWAFVSIAITLFVALLGVMAQGFGWLH